jgi:hypothetical protein
VGRTILYRTKHVCTAEAGIPLFWSAVPLSAAQRTTEMIADQRTGKNSGPALADYRNGASAILLFCILWPIFRNSELRHAVDYSENSGSGIAELRLVTVDYSENSGSGIAELRLVTVDYSENSGSGIAELWTIGSALRKKYR